MTEPTNYLTLLTLTARARLYALHGDTLRFAQYAGCADACRAAQARIDEIKALPHGAAIALDETEWQAIREALAA